MICPECLQEIPDDSVFCENCGFHIRVDRGKTDVMPTVGVDGSEQKSRRYVAPDVPASTKRGGVGPKIAIAVSAVVIVVCLLVGGAFAVRTFTPGIFGLTFVNETAFPDEFLRNAVADQVDADGNGILTNEEKSVIVAIKATPESVEFLKENSLQLSSIDPTPGNAESWQSLPNRTMTLQGIGCFAEVKTLVCGGIVTESIDLSDNANLECVDVQKSEIGTIDLSGNQGLTMLACAPSVQLVGLEESGLYFTDVPIAISRTMPGGVTTSYEMAYSLATGQCLLSSMMQNTGSDYVSTYFAYDDKGRLIERSVDGVGPVYTYAYDEAGRIASMTDVQGTTQSNGNYAFQYDDQGRLSSLTMGTYYSRATRVYAFGEKGLETISLTGEYASRPGETFDNYTSFAYDDQNRLSALDVVYDQDASSQQQTATATWVYDDAGRVVSETYVSKVNGMPAGDSAECYANVTYAGDGHPVSMEYQSGDGVVRTAQFACNQDGYLEHVSVTSPEDDGVGGSEISISYMKVVGSLADRAMSAYVPRVSIDVGLSYWNSPVSENLMFQGGAAPAWGVVFSLKDPSCVPFDSVDPAPAVALCDNESALKAYDRSATTGVPAVQGAVTAGSEVMPELEIEQAPSGEAQETTGDTQPEPSQDATYANIDLADPATYQGVNQFLSNFTETYLPYWDGIVVSELGADDAAAFVVDHCRINKTDVVETAPDNSYEVPGPGGGGAQGVYNMRIPIETFDEVTQRYLGATYDHSQLDGAYFAYEGWLYFGVTAPASPMGVALATSSEGLGGGQYRVSFNVYSAYVTYEALDSTLYAMSESELLERLGEGSARRASGTAVIQETGDRWTLVSMQVEA